MPKHFTKLVRNQSSRNGQRPRVIVLHTTEGHNRPGLSDLTGLASYFNSSSAQASSHYANDAEGNGVTMVPDERKAWTQANANGYCLSIEQVGFSATTKKAWRENAKAQLEDTAAKVAYWSKKYGIPLEHSTQHGVCQHKDLGAFGGGHSDCGPGYPFDDVLKLAKGIEPQDPRFEKWERSQKVNRARLKSILAGRAKLRQRHLENTARYAWTTRAMNATKERIRKLGRLLRRKS